ncbi:hypothetical protein CCUG60884_00283 [Mycobacteroides salmoniphilum]|uniref:Uncharacterized protein n=2 Tax=Mycobacteroides salmoniphilum TaxID=404941 RepID=A0A4V3I1F2_9MYCO|nr:hypothetical protein CCUG60884_00283 [Mycobacteroides salmoniphilum]
MDLTDIALLWGVDPATVRKYYQQGRLPKEDSKTGLRAGGNPRFGWLPETIAAFKRPGQGARTDLRRLEDRRGTEVAEHRAEYPDQGTFSRPVNPDNQNGRAT